MGRPLSILATDEWRRAHPGGMIGLLEMQGVENSQPSAALNRRKQEIHTALAQQYSGYARKDFLALPIMSAYDRYYTRFNKTYHVQLQLESVVLKGKSLPNVSPAVDANFMAELETLVLTAGHDVSKLREPIWMDVSRPGDTMTQLNGTSKALPAGDMVMRDAEGICCCIIYGQDNRSPIAPETSHVLYVAYAPRRVPMQAVESQLNLLQDYIHFCAPMAQTVQAGVLTAPQSFKTDQS